MALTGINPYKSELDDVRVKYEKTAENVIGLQNLYYDTLERYDKISSEVNELTRQRDDLAAREKSLQQLIENLRERIADKECELEHQGTEFRERMERMKRAYQERIDAYNSEIDSLRNTNKIL